MTNVNESHNLIGVHDTKKQKKGNRMNPEQTKVPGMYVYGERERMERRGGEAVKE